MYGIEFSPRDLRLSLVEASANTLGTIIDQALLFCYHYDPVTGKYSLLVLNVVRLAALATIGALGTFIAVMWRRDRRRAVAARGGA
jgi:protein SCO1/2